MTQEEKTYLAKLEHLKEKGVPIPSAEELAYTPPEYHAELYLAVAYACDAEINNLLNRIRLVDARKDEILDLVEKYWGKGYGQADYQG